MNLLYIQHILVCFNYFNRMFIDLKLVLKLYKVLCSVYLQNFFLKIKVTAAWFKEQ